MMSPSEESAGANGAGVATGEYERALGQAIRLLTGTPRCRLSLASVYAFLEPAVALRQIVFARSPCGRADGYMTWAFLSERSLAAYRDDPQRLMPLPEWNEGTSLTIIDLVARPGMARRVIAAARPLLAGHAHAYFVRHDKCMAGNVRKIALRNV